MCRLFAMSTPQRVPATFWLLQAPDSLLRQSHANPDGTGIGIFDESGALQIDKRPLAAYEDAEFAREARDLVSRTFISHVRPASNGANVDVNTHPFAMDGRLFAHNGVIGDKLNKRLGKDLSLVDGDTDSERYFALITVEIPSRRRRHRPGHRPGRAMGGREPGRLLRQFRAHHAHAVVGVPVPGTEHAVLSRAGSRDGRSEWAGSAKPGGHQDQLGPPRESAERDRGQREARR